MDEAVVVVWIQVFINHTFKDILNLWVFLIVSSKTQGALAYFLNLYWNAGTK